MATRIRKARNLAELPIPVPKIAIDALALASRYRESEALQRHVDERRRAILASGAAIVLGALACAAGVFAFLAASGGWLTLPAMALAPLVLLGSLFVLAYVFFSWVESRALVRALGHRIGPKPGRLSAWIARKVGIDLGPAPSMPWAFLGALVVVPLGMLLAAAPALGAAALLLAIATPVVYARLDPLR